MLYYYAIALYNVSIIRNKRAFKKSNVACHFSVIENNKLPCSMLLCIFHSQSFFCVLKCLSCPRMCQLFPVSVTTLSTCNRSSDTEQDIVV